MAKEKACMGAWHTRSNDGSGDDATFIKQRTKHEDGTETSEFKMLENYALEYYVTNPAHRKTHTQKKEYESLENLRSYVTTQTNKARSIAKALKLFTRGPRLGEMKDSPYVYGADITPTVDIREKYKSKYPNYGPKASVAAFDYEWDVLEGHSKTICGSVTMGDTVVLAVNEWFLESIPDAEKKIHACFQREMAKEIKERGLKLHIRVTKDSLRLVRTLYGSMHKLKPDIVSVWNLPTEINHTLNILKEHNVDPKNIFCDPSVPQKYRSFDWREDSLRKVTASDKKSSKPFLDTWNTVNAPATFTFLDAMRFYKRNRATMPNLPSYSFDAILKRELGIQKLHIPNTAPGDHNLTWHKVMQREFKVEYLIYNIFDCVALELLDEKTKDFGYTYLSAAGLADCANFGSGPKKNGFQLHYFLKKRGKIICSVGSTMATALDRLTLGRDGWIATLSAKLIAFPGIQMIKDVPSAVSRFFLHNFDIDLAAGYPSAGIMSNAAKETTVFEVCQIEGEDGEAVVRRLGVNMTAMANNAIAIGVENCGMPTPLELLDLYNRGEGQ